MHCKQAYIFLDLRFASVATLTQDRYSGSHMKKFYLTSLACATALVSACSSLPTKQEAAIIEVQPVAAPTVLQKVEPESSSPHYRLNPRNYFSPLNPILVKEITNALTPKIINPATGEVVSKLPLDVPKKALANNANLQAGADSAIPNQTASAVPAGAHATEPNAANNDNVMTNQANPDHATPEKQDLKAVLLQIDPSLKLDEQAISAIQTQVSPVTPAPVAAADAKIANNQAVADQANANAALNPNAGKILIPLHDQISTRNKGLSTPPASDEKIDVTEMDKDLILIEGKARHYPAYFSNRIERFKAEKKIKQLTQQLDILAVDPRASYEILLRAMKAHVLSRNMDVGTDSAFKSAVYFQRLLKLQPNDPETSFWYGFSLGEGGGFKESIPHLDKAVKADYQEAYLSLAHSYLQMDHKKDALTLLNNYKIKFPTDAENTERLIAEIQEGKRYSIWQ